MWKVGASVFAGSKGRHEAVSEYAGSYAFEDVILGTARTNALARKRRRNEAVIQVLIILCLVAAAASLLWIPGVYLVHLREEKAAAETAQSHVAAWPKGKVAEEYAKARAYNASIAQSGQNVLGEFVDPFAAGSGGASGSRAKPKPRSETDKDYRSLLDEGHGIMGTVRIPSISVRMPIYHGTSDAVLEHGAGHLYGTSLPVGGPSTNAVLSGHRGLPSALLFTRLDELRKGDIFYVQTLGRTLGYRVESIHVIEPDDTHLYTIVPGRDLVTLMTCTPYGVNTQRLVITGTRQSIPDPIPDPEDAGPDAAIAGGAAALCLLVPGVVWAKRRRYAVIPIRHASIGVPALRWRR